MSRTERVESRVRRTDARPPSLAFPLAIRDKTRLISWLSHRFSAFWVRSSDLLALGRAAEGVELKRTLLRLGPNVGLCPWRPWNVLVAQRPCRFLLPEGSATAPAGKLPMWRGESFCWVPPKRPLMLVFETSPLSRDTWKPKLGFRLGPRDLSGSIFCLWGNCLSV